MIDTQNVIQMSSWSENPKKHINVWKANPILMLVKVRFFIIDTYHVMWDVKIVYFA